MNIVSKWLKIRTSDNFVSQCCCHLGSSPNMSTCQDANSYMQKAKCKPWRSLHFHPTPSHLICLALYGQNNLDRHVDINSPRNTKKIPNHLQMPDQTQQNEASDSGTDKEGIL